MSPTIEHNSHRRKTVGYKHLSTVLKLLHTRCTCPETMLEVFSRSLGRLYTFDSGRAALSLVRDLAFTSYVLQLISCALLTDMRYTNENFYHTLAIFFTL